MDPFDAVACDGTVVWRPEEVHLLGIIYNLSTERFCIKSAWVDQCTSLTLTGNHFKI